MPYIAVCPNVSMDIDLFIQTIEQIKLDLYPEENLSIMPKFDEFRRLVKGPVMWCFDFGPGWLSTVEESNEQEYDIWLGCLISKGILMNGLCPNTMSVSAIMDELFRAF